MDPISSADRIAALLRQRLLARARKNAENVSTASSRDGRTDRIQAPTGMGSEAERQERRALIETILAQDLNGPPNDPGFQQVVDRVFGAIESDATGSALLTRVLQNMVDR